MILVMTYAFEQRRKTFSCDESMGTKPPNPATLKLNDPLRLAVAAAIAYPDGSMTAKGLRREAKRGNLVKSCSAPIARRRAIGTLR